MTGVAALDPLEAIEQPWQVLPSDADAIVDDTQGRDMIRRRYDALDLPAVRGVLNRIFEQVDDDRADAVGIAEDDHRMGWRLEGHGVSRAGERRHHLHRAARQRTKVKVIALQREPAVLQARRVQ